jgi:hypothetical protein
VKILLKTVKFLKNTLKLVKSLVQYVMGSLFYLKRHRKEIDMSDVNFVMFEGRTVADAKIVDFGDNKVARFRIIGNRYYKKMKMVDWKRKKQSTVSLVVLGCT